MNDGFTVSVGIPVYNGEKYLGEALQSVAAQTRKANKIFVCDNCSTDNTYHIIQQFIKDNPSQQLVYHRNESNLGYQKNYNMCMSLADTDYLVLLASDDRLKPHAIEKQLEFLLKNKDFAVVGGHEDVIDSKGEYRSRFDPVQLELYEKGKVLEFFEKTNSWITPGTVMMNMNLTREIGYWDTDYMGPDERYWPRVLQKYPIAVLGESLIDMRRHIGQAGWVDNAMKYEQKIQYFKANMKIAEYETDPLRREKLRKLIRKWISKMCIINGRIVWKDYKKRRTAMKYWIYGIQQEPSNLFNGYFLKSLFRSLLNR